MRHLVVGLGEVGIALFNVLRDQEGDRVFGYDKKANIFCLVSIEEELGGEVDVLHICFPMSRHFVQYANNYILEVNPKLTIVHSTVEAGTTRKLLGVKVASPVRGVHPDLKEGLLTYVKYIGADLDEVGAAAKTAMKSLKCRVVLPIESAELMKNLSLSRYGLIISFAREQEEICKKYGVTYEDVVIDWEVSYNEGVYLLGRHKHTRPLITPPKGPIGGHCVVPAMERTAKESAIIKRALELEGKSEVGKPKKRKVVRGKRGYYVGKGTKVWDYVNILDGAVVGEDCIIGAYVEIGRDVKIGDRCKIESGAFIPEGVVIGDEVFVGPNVVFTNDLLPRASAKKWQQVRTDVRKGASIGANSTVLCGVTIGANAMIGAGSMVTKSVEDNALVYGNPARPQDRMIEGVPRKKVKGSPTGK
jgi:acetyltransferase-like isoleucine patch superfamily enzyme